ncbi:hypothetical protein C8Q77DRAFT_1131116, partial [Trametes polyzona]
MHHTAGFRRHASCLARLSRVIRHDHGAHTVPSGTARTAFALGMPPRPPASHDACPDGPVLSRTAEPAPVDCARYSYSQRSPGFSRYHTYAMCAGPRPSPPPFV